MIENLFEFIKTIPNKVTNLISGEALLVLIVLGIYFILIRKNTKVNIKDIIKSHISTLKNYDTQKMSKKDICTFFVIPAIVSICLTFKNTIPNNGIGIILTAFSIFAGLLFNLLILIMDIGRRVKKQSKEKNVDAKKQKLTEALIKETYCNVAFSIVVSLFVIVISLVFVVGLSNIIFKFIISSVLYWLIITFIMTLFMILKRVFRLLDNEMNN